jgi:hypothetical protein
MAFVEMNSISLYQLSTAMIPKLSLRLSCARRRSPALQCLQQLNQWDELLSPVQLVFIGRVRLWLPRGIHLRHDGCKRVSGRLFSRDLYMGFRIRNLQNDIGSYSHIDILRELNAHAKGSRWDSLIGSSSLSNPPGNKRASNRRYPRLSSGIAR